MKRNNHVIHVAAFEPRSLVNGPGVRAVLWVQGCGKRCPGCFNQRFQTRDGGYQIEMEEVIIWIEAAHGIKGVTFSGGEPFDQAGVLAIIAEHIQAMGLGLLIFTGYTWIELKQRKDQETMVLLRATDLLVAGPYVRSLPASHPLLGSGNQEMIYLTDRYRKYPFGRGRRTEFRISQDGTVRMTGFPGGK